MAQTKIYLDTSVYNRPFDDQTQPRIWLLWQNLSPAKVVRLWAAWQMGEGNYLAWRDELFAGETVTTLYEKVQAYQIAQHAEEQP